MYQAATQDNVHDDGEDEKDHDDGDDDKDSDDDDDSGGGRREADRHLQRN